MTATLISNDGRPGVRSTEPLEVCCEHCGKHASYELAGIAHTSKDGKRELRIWVVARKPDDYSAADLRYVLDGPKPTHLETGVMLPKPPGKVKLPKDPVPRFDGSDA